MRIISGRFKSRKLQSPTHDMPARPMTDRVKETLFNQLRGHLEGSCIVDMFAGSGSIGLEAISRGAAHCLFVEQDRRTAKVIQQNIDDLDVNEQADIFVGDALSQSVIARMRHHAPHLVFLDPPYALMDESFGCKRVLEQMARIGEVMDADGYLLLRTPWPIGRKIVQPNASSPSEHIVLKGGDGEGEEELDERVVVGESEEGGEHEILPRHKYEQTRHWLEHPQLLGPETHVYNSMAIHWYQPRRM